MPETKLKATIIAPGNKTPDKFSFMEGDSLRISSTKSGFRETTSHPDRSGNSEHKEHKQEEEKSQDICNLSFSCHLTSFTPFPPLFPSSGLIPCLCISTKFDERHFVLGRFPRKGTVFSPPPVLDCGLGLKILSLQNKSQTRLAFSLSQLFLLILWNCFFSASLER